MPYYFPYAFIRWHGYFSNNQVITRCLSDLHLLLRRKHLQLAAAEERDGRRVHHPLSPQQDAAAPASRPADDGLSLAGAGVPALGDAATRGGPGQLRWPRTSAPTSSLSPPSLRFGVLCKTGFPPDFFVSDELASLGC